MKWFFKILKDERGRQNEGMILVAIIGIILAIAIPNINGEKTSKFAPCADSEASHT
jgi:competence protein ComGC